MYSFNFISRTQRLLISCVFLLMLNQESISGIQLSKSESKSDDRKPLIIIYPKVRFKRSLGNKDKKTKHDLQIQFNHDSEEFAIYLRKNEHLVTSGTVVEWNYPNGTKQLSKLNDIGKDETKDAKDEMKDEAHHNPDDCLFIGEVVQGGNNQEKVKSVAAIDVCDGGYRGYLQIGKDGYIIRPLKEREIYLHPKHRNKNDFTGDSDDQTEFEKGSDDNNERR